MAEHWIPASKALDIAKDAVALCARLGLGPEELKAWSQNLGHSDVLTTFVSYGRVPVQRQGELIRTGKSLKGDGVAQDRIGVLEDMLQELRRNRA